MRRASATGLISMMILLCAARPAAAQWKIIQWLEELSGPGYFTMIGFESHLGCMEKGGLLATEAKAALQEGPVLLRSFLCDQNPTTLAKANREAWKEVGLYFTVAYAQSVAGNDPLDYPAGVSTQETSVKTFTGGAAYRMHDFVDAGGAVGVARFTGGTGKSFNATLLKPYVVFRPLARVRSAKWQQFVHVRLDFDVFPSGFHDSDFGATGNRLNGNAELVTTLVVGVDFGRFLGWK